MFVKSIKAALAAGTMLVPVGAIAQSVVSDPGPSAQQRSNQRAEIIVTAQRRRETLQDLPIAFARLRGDQLAAQKISSVEMFDTHVTNPVVQRSPFQPFLAICDPGASAGGRASEQSVTTDVDGNYAGRTKQFLNTFFNVDTTLNPSIIGTNYE
jgi:iron complex outermembrane receptor protein